HFAPRPLKRAIQKYLEDELAEMIINASVTSGSRICVGYDEGADKIVTEINAPNPAASDRCEEPDSDNPGN
ncbi:hypothetical protein, partial [Muribaculum sp.]|uniref:hypothetical protein n=1 Tax=Muribaculum sp. TaxID=1918611 RepID=UPI0023C8E293